MSLIPGTRIGSYEVLGSLGAGGMGEVYRAKDSKLKREVAIKVLPAEVATDRERLARFRREAEVLASLNHPHIAHIYGVEDGTPEGAPHERFSALVLELVEGEDISDTLATLLKFDPDWKLAPETPPSIRRLLKRTVPPIESISSRALRSPAPRTLANQ